MFGEPLRQAWDGLDPGEKRRARLAWERILGGA